MKARELAEKLIENPELEVGIRKFSGENVWPVNCVETMEWDDTVHSSLLVRDPTEGGIFVLVDALARGERGAK